MIPSPTLPAQESALPELANCPFCGGEPFESAIEAHSHAMTIDGWKIPDHGGSHTIECACGAGLIADTRAEVLAMWNRRATPPIQAHSKSQFKRLSDLGADVTPPIQQGVVEALEPELGDTVRHIPSGEEWLVVYIRDGKLAACGWPDELVPAKDCVLVSRMPLRKKLDLLRDVSRGDGHRAEHARALLRSACLVAESVAPPSLRATSGENGNG